MSDEKRKNDEGKTKVEWSFSFEDLGQKFNEFIGGLAGDTELKTTQVSADLEGASGATMKINLSVGKATLEALPAGTDKLIEAEIVHAGEVKLEVEGTDHKTVKLRQPTKAKVVLPFQEVMRAFSDREELRWDVRVNPDIPLNLKLDSGVGTATLNLTGLKLESLDVDTGVGETHVTLPVSAKSFLSEIDTGVGQVNIHIPAGTATDMKVKGGVGAVNLYVSPDAAVRIKVSDNLGGVSVPSHFKQVKEKSDFMTKGGVWETEGFEVSSQQVTINYKGGVGRLKVATHEIA